MKYNTISSDYLYFTDYSMGYSFVGDIKKNDPITIIGYKKLTDIAGFNYFYYAIVSDKAAGVYCLSSEEPLHVNIPLSFLPSVDDPQVMATIEQEQSHVIVRRQEEEERAKVEEEERKRIEDSIQVVKNNVKIQQLLSDDSVTLESMKQKYMHKTWYYKYNRDALEYECFVPIEVIDIQIQRISVNEVHFPMKLKYKRTNKIVSFDATIFHDGTCDFDMAFHNIPPEKEFPKVRHWNAIKNREIVLGLNKEEVELIWGYPDDVYTSRGRWGVHEQWAYYSQFGLHTRYVYFDNGKVTAIQRNV